MASLPPGVGGAPQNAKQQEEDRKRQEEARKGMLTQILNNEARERLSRISIVKPEKARGVEDLLIRMAQNGQLQGQVTEPQLVQYLEQITQLEPAKTKITFNRRGDEDDDNWEEELFKD